MPEVDHDAGPAEQVVGPDGVGDPVGPDLLGVVVEDGHPALDARARAPPTGRRTTAATIWRRLAVTSGTEEVTAMPVTAVSMSRPSRSSSWVSRRACSSAVRSATVDSRQWWASPVGSFPSRGPVSLQGRADVVGEQPDHRLGVPDVDGQQHVSLSRPASGRQIESQIEHGGRVGEGPDRDEVGAGRRQPRGRLEGHPARHLDQRAGRPCTWAGAQPATSLGTHVVEHDHRWPRRPRPRPPARPGRTRPPPSGPATVAGPGPPPRRW